MRCFIHREKDAIATCRICGKGMCDNCSAYSNHSGICPECRRIGFINEVKQKSILVKELKCSMFWSIVLTILFFWTLIGLVCGLWKYFSDKNEKKKLEQRIQILENEIQKLNDILNTTGGPAFI